MIVWASELDDRTCDNCWALDGSSIEDDGVWPMGEPGTIHPGCRCVGVYMAGDSNNPIDQEIKAQWEKKREDPEPPKNYIMTETANSRSYVIIGW
jgi:hypothetical protein